MFDIYEILCDFNNIYKAYKKAHRGKSNDRKVIEFDKNKMYNLHKIQELMKNKQWDKLFIYYRFIISKPKRRVVDALEFEGRIIQHVLCDEILKPYFEPRLIKENTACRESKGTEYAIQLAKDNFRKAKLKYGNDLYIMKADIHKYFPSISKIKLKSLLSNFPDEEIKALLCFIIDTGPEDVGIPIGNQSSQWFALYYLDKIDRIAKEKFGCKYYVRYMDDMITFGSKEELKRIREEQSKVLISFGLEFNSKTQIYPSKAGVCFLGWKLYKNDNKIVRTLDPHKKKQKKDKIQNIYLDWWNNKEDTYKTWERIQSLRAYLLCGKTYGFRNKYLNINYYIS